MRGESLRSTLLIAAGVAGLTGVLAGAFGTHALEDRLTPEMLNAFEVGARYHLLHAIAVLALALAAPARSRLASAAGWFMIAGIVIFSGSLYALALSGERWLGMITPIGGAAFMVGWALVIAFGTRFWPVPDA